MRRGNGRAEACMARSPCGLQEKVRRILYLWKKEKVCDSAKLQIHAQNLGVQVEDIMKPPAASQHKGSISGQETAPQGDEGPSSTGNGATQALPAGAASTTSVRHRSRGSEGSKGEVWALPQPASKKLTDQAPRCGLLAGSSREAGMALWHHPSVFSKPARPATPAATAAATAATAAAVAGFNPLAGAAPRRLCPSSCCPLAAAPSANGPTAATPSSGSPVAATSTRDERFAAVGRSIRSNCCGKRLQRLRARGLACPSSSSSSSSTDARAHAHDHALAALGTHAATGCALTPMGAPAACRRASAVALLGAAPASRGQPPRPAPSSAELRPFLRAAACTTFRR
jgi:hypothetical protein